VTFNDRHPLKRWLIDHFAQVSRILDGVIHLDLVPPDESDTGRVSFFNPRILSKRASAGLATTEEQQRRWLFVLAMEDYQYQPALCGKVCSEAQLICKLREAARAGRQPVLVAPRACIASFGGAGPPAEGLLALDFCSHAVFQSLLLGAEYVF